MSNNTSWNHDLWMESPAKPTGRASDQWPQRGPEPWPCSVLAETSSATSGTPFHLSWVN